MIPSATAEYDFSLLGQKVSELIGILLGRGDGGDVQKALKVEAGQCAWKIAEELGPSTLPDAKQKVERNIASFLNSDEGHYSVFTEAAQMRSKEYSSWVWLSAGPNWLLGIAASDYQLAMGADDAISAYYDARKMGGRGKAYVSLGTRALKSGKTQRILQLNRLRVSQSTYAQVKQEIFSRLGQSRASFARIAAEYIPAKRIPGWVRDKISVVIQNGKSILNDSGITQQESPFLEFGSRAKGVESNPVILEKIRLGAQTSQRTLESKIRKVISGQTYSWNTGQVFKPTTFDEN